MIQRIQSLFLLLVLIISTCMFFLPIAGFISDTYILKATGLVKTIITAKDIPFDGRLLMIFIPGLALMSLFIIFRYKNRVLQIKLCRIGILINVVIIVLIFYFADMLEKELSSQAQYKVGAVLPLLSVIFLYLAVSAIRKDEKLVKSTDRLR